MKASAAAAAAGAPARAVPVGGTARRSFMALWVAAALMLAMGLLSLVNLARFEFGPWRGAAIQIDELHFAACAARGVALGQVPVAGCHDNKGPVIHLVHQLVQLASARYDLLAIKVAAFAVVALVVGLAAQLARQLGGTLAAVAAAALVLLSLSVRADYLALKTETVGTVFVLASLAVLVAGGSEGRVWTRLLGGSLLGLALLTKQTNLLVALAVMTWFSLFPGSGPQTGQRWRACGVECAWFGAGLLAPLLGALAWFYTQGSSAEFLAGLIVYPSVYGAASDPASSATMLRLWHWAAVLAAFALAPLTGPLFVAAAVACGQRSLGAGLRVRDDSCLRMLVLFAALALLFAVFLAPKLSLYLTVPPMVLMSVLGGVLIADLSAKWRADDAAPALGAALVAAAMLMVATSWHGNGGKPKLPPTDPTLALMADARGEFGYALGLWPEFYAHAGLVSSSNVMYPWALDGAPANFFYALPSKPGAHLNLLNRLRAQGAQRLLADFERSPPRYIAVIDAMARAPGSTRVADVPGFDDYLQRHCRLVSLFTHVEHGKGSLFRCNPRPTAAAAVGAPQQGARADAGPPGAEGTGR